jgi:23S rRNA pseudouridine955/2504/2580 synthase
LKKFSLESQLIFENENYFAVNKPSGISVLDDRKEPNNKSLLEIAKAYNSSSQVCHRIDKETSGVIVFAKNPEAYRNLAIQFEDRSVAKMYHALCHGRHNFKEELIENNILHKNGISTIDRTGKFSASIFETVNIFGHFTLIECMPLTGRTHQIRVQLAYLGAPIVGDEKYGGKLFYLSEIKKKFNQAKFEDEKPMLSRSALHAYRIKFNNLDEKSIMIEAPYQKDMFASLKQIKSLSKI